MDAIDNLRVILVHDWLTGMRGGEKVLDVLCRGWPNAPLYTLLHRRGSVSPAIEALRPITSFLQKFPSVHRHYRYLLPLMPWAVSRWKLPNADLVLSTSHCVAKGVLPPQETPHICYCFTPMRYAWHMKDAYFAGRGIKGWLREMVLGRLREWDRRTADRVTHFVAISKTIQQRIRDCYGRDSAVIYPPVDTGFFTPAPVQREDYYLAVSAFAPYKRLDLAIAACRQMQRKLVIIGNGQDELRLRKLAGPDTAFLGWQPDEVIRDHLRRCRALLFPGEEDFGIVPVEADACGAPVIAFGRGGATETIAPLHEAFSPTGVWFEEQSVECLAEALRIFEKHADEFDPRLLRRQAMRFNARRFEEELFGYLGDVLGQNRTLRQAA